MTFRAVFLGSIGVIADTSDLQRQAFNTAFDRFGLNWHWDWDTYVQMLAQPGGRQRIAQYAERMGQHDEVDVGAIYAVKQGSFDALAASARVPLRPGVGDLMQAARKAGMMRAFVTSTSRRQVETTFSAISGALHDGDFDYVGDRSLVHRPKPDPEIYHHALRTLEVAPSDVLAIEDTPESAQAALSAGLSVIGFPGRAAYGRSFPDGVPVVECVTPGLLSVSPFSLAAE